MTSELLKNFTEAHEKSNCAATVLTAEVPDAAGYGRVIHGADDSFKKIVEDKDASEEEKKIREINAGVYCFDVQKLFKALEKVGNDNAQGEYYLPDVLPILKAEGEKIGVFKAEYCIETIGINTRAQRAAADRAIRMRKEQALMESGVTIIDPNTTFIDDNVKIGQDTIIYPNTYIEGNTIIGDLPI